MPSADAGLILIGTTVVLALSLMLGVRLISPTRFAQGLGCGMVGVAVVKSLLVMNGAAHG